jgi:hypothetical protein
MKDEVEVAEALRFEPGQAVQRGADPNLHPLAQAGAGDVGPSDFRVPFGGLERDEAPLGGKSTGDPDRRVAAERADLHSLSRAGHSRQEVQHFAVRRGDVDRRQPRGLVRGEGRVQEVVLPDHDVSQVVVDGLPATLVRQRFGSPRLG